MNFNRLGKLNNLLTADLKRKPTIILEPNPEQLYRIYGTADDIVVGIDTADWEIPDSLKQFLADVASDNSSNEEKILKIYQKLCEYYTYDDNVLSYIKKTDDDTFFLPDAYGRETNAIWKENRKKHNRTTCFEISRILAKSIKEVIKLSGHSNNYDVCIIWDEANTHYFVGVACDNYYVSLDLDDFTQIKDLTRMKTELTLEGIKLLEDPYDKFGTVVRKFNGGRSKIAKEHIQRKRDEACQDNNANGENLNESHYSVDSDDINFFQYAVQILKEEYNLDSAGIYEYLKEIVDTKLGARFRKKVWKEVENEPGIGTRYTRCLIVTINEIPYIVDVTKENPCEIFRIFNEQESEKEGSKLIPFKEMSRDWKDDPYDGR